MVLLFSCPFSMGTHGSEEDSPVNPDQVLLEGERPAKACLPAALFG